MSALADVIILCSCMRTLSLINDFDRKNEKKLDTKT